jgi:hypothetical protein
LRKAYVPALRLAEALNCAARVRSGVILDSTAELGFWLISKWSLLHPIQVKTIKADKINICLRFIELNFDGMNFLFQKPVSL